MQRLWKVLTMMFGLWTLLACGVDADDRDGASIRRMHGGHQHHPASPERVRRRRDRAAERRGGGGAVRAQLERGEVTMAKIRAGHARYCE